MMYHNGYHVDYDEKYKLWGVYENLGKGTLVFLFDCVTEDDAEFARDLLNTMQAEIDQLKTELEGEDV